ncbi:thermostable direct hemolysin-family toxin, partial [Vibrio cholerae]|uniref:thermostable direct hemolysin-family toxin n=1 Tax=Vibrio cholerae TaxID=666 RepID=UPI0011D54548
MIKKLFLISAALSFHTLAIELPSIPFPSPGSDEIVFVVLSIKFEVQRSAIISNKTFLRCFKA